MTRVTWPVAGLCLALSACHLATEVEPQLDVSLVASSQVASAANPVAITITVANHGTRTVATNDPRSYDCMRGFVVLDGNGNVLAPTPRTCSLILYSQVELAPGDSVVIRDQWSADAVHLDGSAVKLAAGSYRLVARVFAGQQELTSEPLAITVASPDVLP